jgi:N-acetylglutamate synthase and related acetyltransferases
LLIRDYKKSDNESIYDLFYNTVHYINARDYNKFQLDVWAKKNIDIDKWCKKFIKSYTLVADEDRKIIGFANIYKNGYFDCLYVHKDYQNIGIGKHLVNKIENYASKMSTSEIITYSSITAKSFFISLGYNILSENIVCKNSQKLLNYKMRKILI